MTNSPWLIKMFRTSGIKFKHGLIENAMFRWGFETSKFSLVESNNQSESFGTVEPTPVEASLIYQDTKIEFNSSVSH